MFNNIFDGINKLKDKGTSYLFKRFFNSKIDKYGEMIKLKIDSIYKNIELEVLLKGEKESIFINIEKYEVVHKDDSNYIKFKNVSASREWIEVLIHNVAIPSFAPKKMIEIDSTYAKILDLLI